MRSDEALKQRLASVGGGNVGRVALPLAALLVLTIWLLVGAALAEDAWIDVHTDQLVIETDDSFQVLICGGNVGDSPVVVNVYVAIIDSWGDW